MRTDCQAESILGNVKDTDVHARLIYSGAYLWSVLDVIFFWGKSINKVEMLIQEKIVDLDLQQKIWYIQGVLSGQ